MAVGNQEKDVGGGRSGLCVVGLCGSTQARNWTRFGSAIQSAFPQAPSCMTGQRALQTVIADMALPGSPETNARSLPSAWTSLDGGNIMQEAQEALDSYKKKDASKGALLSPLSSWGGCMLTHLLGYPHLSFRHIPIPCALRYSQSYPHIRALVPPCHSCRPIQGSRQRPHHEAELLQDHCIQPVPGGHPVLEKRTWMETRRPPSEFIYPLLCVETSFCVLCWE